MRTYTIKIDYVNVTITDDMTIKKGKETISDDDESFEADSYIGSTKQNVVITNTGNTDAFIRATIIGQWYDAEKNAPVFGFTDYTTQKVETVDSWYQDQFVSKTRSQGTFEGLVGYDTSYSGDWVLGNDGYYYYKNVVEVGESVPDDDPLFTKYTVGSVPAVKIAGEVKQLYFVLEISTQAISAKKLDGSYYTYEEAWRRAKSITDSEVEP